MHEETTEHYITEALAATIAVAETRTLVGENVQIKVNDAEPISYKISEISTVTGINGLKYTAGVGFTWTISAENANDRLELIYTCEETK